MIPPHWIIHTVDNGQINGMLLNAPEGSILCFSMMAPVKAVSGCTRLRQVGGYSEVLVDNAEFVVGFEDTTFQVFNIGWLPTKPYLRLKDGTCIDVTVRLSQPVNPLSDSEPSPIPDGLRLVPKPTHWEPSGKVVDARLGFELPKNPPLDGAFLSVENIAMRNNLGPFLGGPVPIITLETDAGHDEGYELVIAPNGITITAKTRTGFFYAAISLLNLMVNHDGHIPCGVIKDQPRFEWRGQQLDCVRHFYQPETLIGFLDLMALLKLNRFHWHFSDDEAFRLEVSSFPEIWKQTRFRGEGQVVPGVFGGGQGPTGGSYSLDFASGLVSHARDLAIEVLPEIEIPSHAYALTQVFPALMDPADNSMAPSVQGYIDNTMNPGQPFMWDLTDALIDEIAGIFPFGHIHLGCDERPPTAWQKSPLAQQVMRDNGLETLDDLQAWTIGKAAARVKKNGARPCAWEEAARGGTDGIGTDTILFSWTGQGPGLEAARKGFDVVMSPAQHVYLDMAHSDEFADIGARWAGSVSLADTVNWHPVPPDEPELEANILGVEGAFWGEFTLDDDDMRPMIVPRILGIAEMGWRAVVDPATPSSIKGAAAAYFDLFHRAGWSKL